MEENSELAEAVSAVATSETGVMLTAVPLACVLGYGMSRAMASIFSEVRNGVFAVVSLQAVTSLGRQVFEHLHALDLGFHLNRETGAVTRIMQVRFALFLSRSPTLERLSKCVTSSGKNHCSAGRAH